MTGDVAGLARLRPEIRERMRSSALMDAKGFCAKVEAAYRAMWADHCARGAQNG